jgi:large subunit ribosomal protein L1
MANNQGKQYQAAAKQVQARDYPLEEAVPLLQKIKFAKFDETVEVHLRLGVDPKHADQMVRGTVLMPNGLGKAKKVLVIAGGDKQKEAEEAGADFVGGENMVNKIQSEGWTDYDAVIATPDMMRSVGKLGKILGPRGLMPNPRPAQSPRMWPKPSRKSKPARLSSAWTKPESFTRRSVKSAFPPKSWSKTLPA